MIWIDKLKLEDCSILYVPKPRKHDCQSSVCELQQSHLAQSFHNLGLYSNGISFSLTEFAPNVQHCFQAQTAAHLQLYCVTRTAFPYHTLHRQPSPTILYTDSLPLPYFTQTAFPYHTLHRQPSPTILYTDSLPLPYFTQTAYPDNRHSPDCVLHCVGRLAIVSQNNLIIY